MLSIHRALALHILNLLDNAPDPTRLNTAYHRAVSIVRRSFPRGSAVQGPTNHTWPDCEIHLPHFLSLKAIYRSRQAKIEPTQVFATLVVDAANYLWERGLTNDVISTLALGEDVCNSLMTSKNKNNRAVVPLYANICAIAGAVYSEIGLSGRALALQKCERALELRRLRIQHLEEEAKNGGVDITEIDGILLANAYNDMGVLNMQYERFGAAASFFAQSLEIKRKWTSEEASPALFGESYKNISVVRLAQGRKEEAAELATKSLELHGKGMNEMTFTWQKVKFILAWVTCYAGDTKRALQIHKEVLKARIQIIGQGHRRTRDSMYMIGEIYRLKGQYAKAEYAMLITGLIISLTDGSTESTFDVRSQTLEKTSFREQSTRSYSPHDRT